MSADVLFVVDVIARDGGIRARGYSSRNMRRKFVQELSKPRLATPLHAYVLSLKGMSDDRQSWTWPTFVGVA